MTPTQAYFESKSLYNIVPDSSNFVEKVEFMLDVFIYLLFYYNKKGIIA